MFNGLDRFAPLLGLAGTLLAAGCDDPASPERSARGASGLPIPSFSSHGAAHPRVTALGTLGVGSATPGGERQEFDVDVAADLSGRLFYRDWTVVHPDGTVGTLTVDDTDPSTAITAFRDGSAACADPTRGVELDGTGRLGIGELVSFTVVACDIAGAGSGLDFLRMQVQPPREYRHGALLSSGDIVKSAGRHFYVAPSDASPPGNDANPCTETAPCFTMERVSHLLAPGDLAHFGPGYYSWDGQLVTANGTASARITYASDVRWGAKITGTGMRQGMPACGIIQNMGDYVDIVGFDLTGPCSNGLLQDGNYGRIIGNRVHDLPGTDGFAGIMVDCCLPYDRTGNEVIGNVVDRIGPLGASNNVHGIYLAGPANTAVNNIVTRAAAACIQTFHSATRLVISNNTVANCGRYGIQISAQVTNDFTTVNNNIVVNVNVGSSAEYGYGIHAPAGGSSNVYNNNIVYNNPRGNVIPVDAGTESGTITLTRSQFEDSLLVNYGIGNMDGDYHLRSGAVAIDAGTTSCAPGVSDCVPLIDFDGVIRSAGTAWDIGAYQYSP